MKLKAQKHYRRIARELDVQTLQPNPARIAHSLEKLFEYDTGLFFSNLAKVPVGELCKVMLELSGREFAEALGRLSVHKILRAMEKLPSSDVTDFMKRVEMNDPVLAEKLYAMMNPQDRHEISELSKYNETQAGAYMETEVLTATPSDTIESVRQNIRDFRQEEPHSPIVKLFVTDEEGHLISTLHFSELILYESSQTIDEVLQTIKPHRPITIRPTSPIDEVIRLFDEYDLSVVGVVNKQGLLKGRILYDDIYDLMRHYETDQVYKLAGVDDEAEEENLSAARKKRLLWLVINLATVLGASVVIGIFEETIAQYIALAILMPVVAALGGNAGMQAVTVTVRRLALGEIEPSQAYSVLKRELAIVAVNGLAIAALVAAAAGIWFADMTLSMVIAMAIFLNLTVAGIVGSLIPLLLKRFGVDPAVASSVLLSTTTDAFGFFIFLMLANLFLI